MRVRSSFIVHLHRSIPCFLALARPDDGLLPAVTYAPRLSRSRRWHLVNGKWVQASGVQLERPVPPELARPHLSVEAKPSDRAMRLLPTSAGGRGK
jgi:hypothetical protein